ncbi:MAG: CARDB domain-containing protein [Bacteroidota bacterium]
MKKLFILLFIASAINSANAQTIYIDEDFSTGSGTTPPAGWMQLILLGDPLVDSFHFDNPGGRIFNAPITDPAAIFDSDNYSDDGAVENVALISPSFDASAAGTVFLEWDQYFRGGVGGEVFVVVYNGVSFDTVYSATASSPNPDAQFIDISSSAAGVSNAMVGFIWTGDFSWYWIIDNVLVFSPLSDDVGVIAVDAPTSGCGLSVAEVVSIRVKNFGLSAQSNIPVLYSVNGGAPVNETIVATINPGDTLLYTFTATADLSSPGTYIIDSWTSLVGDGDNTNDSITNYQVIHGTPITSFPYSEDFETFIPGTPGTLQNDWRNAAGDDFDWYVNTGNTPSNNTGPIGDHTSGAGIYMYTEASAPNNPYLTASLLSPCFDISSMTTPMLIYWYHMFGANMGNLYIDIYSSGSWITADSIIGPQQTADTDPWIADTVDLSPFTGVIQVRFRGITGADYSSDIAIDDIEIRESQANDVGVIAIDAPTSGCSLSATESVTVRVTNFGTSTQSNIPVSFSVNGGAPVNETIVPVINPGDTLSYTFTTTTDLSVPGTYDIDAWTELVGDGDNTNDSLNNYLVDNIPVIISFPYLEDFESGQGGWSSGGISPTWAFGTPAKNTINSAGSGVNSWVTGGLSTGLHNSNESSYAIGPCFDFSALGNPVIRLNIWWNSESSWDGTVLQSSIDYGATWQNVGAFGDPDNWFNDNTINGNPGGQQEGWTGRDSTGDGSGGWVIASHDLAGLGGEGNVLLRIAFGSDGSVEDDGFAFDDVEIFEKSANDVGVIAIDAPNSGCGLSATESVTVRVKNFGSSAQSNIPVSYSVNGGPPVNETIVPVINPGDTLSYTFTATSDFSALATYIIDSWTSLVGDSDNSNDSTTNYQVIHGTPITSFPYSEDFETFIPGTPGTLQNDWQNATGDDFDWYVNTGGTPSVGTGPSGDHTSGAGIYMYTEASAPNFPYLNASLVSPCFDISSLTNPILIYWYHMFGVNMGNLYIDIYSGGSWVTADSITVPQQGADTDPWIVDTVDLSPFIGVIQVRYRGITGAGFESDMSIDDIEIKELQANDVGVIAIDAPTSGCGLSAAEVVSVRVKNFGLSAQSNIPVSYSVNGGPPVNETISATVNPGDTVTYTFTSTEDLSVPGTYIFDAWTTLGTDGDNTNDSILNYFVINAVINSFPYFEDFESGTLGAFINLDVIGSLNWINTDIRGSDPGHSTTNSAYFGNPVDTTYNTGFTEGANLTLSCIDLTSLTNVQLSFNYFLRTEQFDGYDIAQVLISTDGISYDTLADNQLTIGNLMDGSGAWQNFDTSISAYAGNPTVFIRFSFNTVDDFANNFEGFYIDDMTIYEPSASDVGVIAIDAPVSHCLSGANDSITIRVKNFGGNPESNIPVSYSINGGTPVNDTVTVTINPGDTLIFTFLVDTNLSAPGTYVFDSWTNLVVDSANSNDSSVIVIDIYPLPVIDLGADTTICQGNTVDLNTNNFGFVSYLWSNGLTDSTITTDTAGVFILTVTDGNGCSNSDTIIIAIYPAMTLTSSSVDATCGNPDGEASVSVSGGTPSYTYLWDDPASQTADTATGLTAGAYTVLVTDAPGCTASDIISVNNSGAHTVSISSSTNISCNGSNDGQATVLATGGTPPYTYLWDDPASQTDSTATGLTAATYTATVTDNIGCVATAIVTITEPAAISLTSSAVDATCSQNNGSVTVIVSGGTGAYSYLWDDPASQTFSTANGLFAGTYTVTVTDANGCTDSAVESVTDISGGTISIASSNNASCNSSCDGDATASITGGIPPYTYLWDDSAAQTTTLAAGLCAGTYNITITDANGCISTSSVTITEPTAISLALSSIDASCGNPDGSATLTASGGTPPYTYQWDDPGSQTTDTATGLSAGAYTVLVTDADGCTTGSAVSVNDAGAATVSISFIINISCNGVSDGETTVSASGGTPPYTYQWDDPGSQTDSIATGLAAGTYTAAVTDNNGCVATSVATIFEPTAITLTTSAIDANCGQDDGSATLTASGGIAPYSYLWDDPASQISSTATGLFTGTYLVVVTDANGCSENVPVIVNDLAGGTASVSSSNDATCNGICDGDATASITGGTAPYTYLWDDPSSQTGTMVTGLCVGTYNVLITDANGCISTASITITEPSAIILTLSSIDASCGNPDGSATLTASGGTPPYSYQWDDPGSQTTVTATGLSAGAYTVLVTDANACTESSIVSVNNAGAPSVTISSSTDINCNGDSDGEATVSATGGNPPYTYLWNDPDAQTDSMATGLAGGIYTATVTDNVGCIATAIITINEPTLLTTNISGINVSCNGLGDGSATVTPSGGTPPYTYLWNIGQTDSTATGLYPGNYTVNVNDANGCLASDIITITPPLALSLIVSSTDATCGNTDGTVTVSVTGGTSPYSYLWDDPSSQTTATATGLAGGEYSVSVTDANGCTATAADTVNEAGAPTALITSITDASCSGCNDGSATLTASGGTPPYSYLWDDPASQTSSTATGLGVGNYTVTVTDAAGCSAIAAVTINESSALSTTITKLDVSCNGLCDGQATVSASGGTLPYTYQWDDPASQTTAAATGLCVGNYSVTVTDADGSVSSQSIVILQPPAISLSASVTDATCGNADGSATVTASGVTSPYTYTWNNGDSTDTLQGVSAGTYICTVTDADGCFETIFVLIGNSDGPVISVVYSDVSCYGSIDGTATATVSGGTAPYTYLWDDPSSQTAAAASGLPAGAYKVTVTDATGCSNVSSSVTVSEPALALTATTIANNTIQGACVGDITVYASGGTSPYTYLWDDPDNQATQTATGLCPGTYTVIVIDANGCMINATDTVSAVSSINQYTIISSQLKVYPNPASGEVTFEYQFNQAYEITVSIRNLVGQEMTRSVIPNTFTSFSVNSVRNLKIKIDLGDCPEGIYFYQVKAGDKVYRGKLTLIK